MLVLRFNNHIVNYYYYYHNLKFSVTNCVTIIMTFLFMCAHLYPCALGVWEKVLGPVAERRAETGMLRLFPIYLKGEDLFGLTISAVTRIAESVVTMNFDITHCIL